MLEQKFQLYKKLCESVQDSSGFIESDHCDSLLFSGLLGCVVPVDINAAQDKNGRWHRRPVDRPCWPEHSKSTISRDMLLGLAFFAWANKRLDISEQVIEYALSHWCRMGEGTGAEGFSRIMLTPPLLATFAWVSYRLGGPSRAWLRWVPASCGGKPEDFQAHLQVLHCLLRTRLTGKNSYKKIFKHHAERQRNNALFAYANDDLQKALRLMNDVTIWPQDTLPMRAHRKTPWVFERDWGSDWLPADDDLDKVHSGGDFMFLYALMMDMF